VVVEAKVLMIPVAVVAVVAVVAPPRTVPQSHPTIRL
jgi:hypothetical protein